MDTKKALNLYLVKPILLNNGTAIELENTTVLAMKSSTAVLALPEMGGRYEKTKCKY